MKNKSSNKPSEKSRIERVTDFLELIRKIAVNVFLFLTVFIITIAVIVQSFKHEMVIYPFKVSKKMNEQGYTGEAITVRILDRMNIIKKRGTVYYKSNNVVLPSWDSQIGEVKGLVGGDFYSKINSIFNFLLVNRSQTGNGEFTVCPTSNDSLQISFRITGRDDFLSAKDKNVDSLINRTAEFLMEKSDPYDLGIWYIVNSQKVKALKLAQQLLNDKDATKDGIGLHLRGTALLSVSDTLSDRRAMVCFRAALKQLKAPWLTYNNLGVAYYYCKKYDTAAMMYEQSIKTKTNAFGTYRNYGNLLYKKYTIDKNKAHLDTAAKYYELAIKYDVSNVDEYLSVIPPLYAQNKIHLAQDYFEKAKEIAADDYRIYFQMGVVQQINGNFEESIINFNQAYVLCKNNDFRATIKNNIMIDSIGLKKNSITGKPK